MVRVESSDLGKTTRSSPATPCRGWTTSLASWMPVSPQCVDGSPSGVPPSPPQARHGVRVMSSHRRPSSSPAPQAQADRQDVKRIQPLVSGCFEHRPRLVAPKPRFTLYLGVVTVSIRTTFRVGISSRTADYRALRGTARTNLTMRTESREL